MKDDPRRYCLPLWYVSPGTFKPGHIPHTEGIGMDPRREARGPDGQSGTVYGGAWDPLAYPPDGWAAAGVGVWIYARCSSPQACIKLDLHPRVRTWRTVAGAEPHHAWYVPVLLTPRLMGGQRIGLGSALSPLWDGKALADVGDLGGLQRRLLAILGAFAADDWSVHETEAVELAVDLLRLGHIPSRDDLIGARWISEDLVISTLHAACDMDQQAVAAILEEACR